MSRLVWFRDDLRLHDNEMLSAAVEDTSEPIAFVYVMDDSLSASPGSKPIASGTRRAEFQKETLRSLRKSLLALGADLLCVRGETVATILKLCRDLDAKKVFYSRSTAHNERLAELAIEKGLQALGCKARAFQTQTLICDTDLTSFDPYVLKSFSKFRDRVERDWPVREPVPTLHSIENPMDVSGLSDISQIEIEKTAPDHTEDRTNRGFKFEAGEPAALQRLDSFIWQTGSLLNYRKTRNGLIEFNDSSKLSPYLANGSLSARAVFQQVRKFETDRGANDSTLWFLYELLWRDHFRFQAQSRGAGLFLDRACETTHSPEIEQANFQLWCAGRTANDFVNAAMIELAETGWLSNRMRQVAASYLIFDLGVDWRWGAEWYEAQLIDYEPASNWGNWSYIAGAGSMNRPHRFDVVQQEAMYDAARKYQKNWLSR